MSESAADGEISKVGGSVGVDAHHDDDDDDDDDDKLDGGAHGRDSANVHKKKKKQQQHRKGGYGCGRSFTKEVLLFPFTKANKRLTAHHPTNSNKKSSFSSSSSCANNNTSTTASNSCFSSGKSAVLTCFCFKQHPTLESSPVESHTSDPNDPRFTFDMLKTLIENNDFYSKECNPHLYTGLK